MGSVAPGSFLVIAHAPADAKPEVTTEMAHRYNDSGVSASGTSARMRPRTREEIARFFDGLELIGPGISAVTDWLPGASLADLDADAALTRYVGMGRKPG
jgi:hypothetical protein